MWPKVFVYFDVIKEICALFKIIMFLGHCTTIVIKPTYTDKNKVNIYIQIAFFNKLLSGISFIIIFCEISFLAYLVTWACKN